jgi:hypothetical protein
MNPSDKGLCWQCRKWTPLDDNEGKIFLDMVISNNCGKEKTAVFAVRDNIGQCLNTKGKFEYEPLPSSRTDSFLKRCRFDTIQYAQNAYEKYVKREKVND